MRMREGGAAGLNPAWIRVPLGIRKDPTVLEEWSVEVETMVKQAT